MLYAVDGSGYLRPSRVVSGRQTSCKITSNTPICRLCCTSLYTWRRCGGKNEVKINRKGRKITKTTKKKAEVLTVRESMQWYNLICCRFWASWQSLHSLRHGDQCWEDQADDKQHQWHQDRDQSEWTEAWDSHKLRTPGLIYNWWGFQAWDTLQDSTDNSSINNVETSLNWQQYFSQLQDTTDALPCHIHLPVCLWIMDPHSRAPKKNTSQGNEVLPLDTTHLIQWPCYQRGSPCQDPADNWTTWRPPDDRKETQTAMVWSCLPFTRSGQIHLASHSKRWKKTRRTKEEVGRQHQGMDRPGVRKVPEGSEEQGK